MALLKYEIFSKWTLAEPDGERDYRFSGIELDTREEAEDLLSNGDYLEGTVVVRKEYQIRYKDN